MLIQIDALSGAHEPNYWSSQFLLHIAFISLFLDFFLTRNQMARINLPCSVFIKEIWCTDFYSDFWPFGQITFDGDRG